MAAKGMPCLGSEHGQAWEPCASNVDFAYKKRTKA